MMLTLPVPLSIKGIEILGIPIGQDRFVTEGCIKVAESGQELCSETTMI